jgi:hypothetical protein
VDAVQILHIHHRCASSKSLLLLGSGTRLPSSQAKQPASAVIYEYLPIYICICANKHIIEGGLATDNNISSGRRRQTRVAALFLYWLGSWGMCGYGRPGSSKRKMMKRKEQIDQQPFALQPLLLVQELQERELGVICAAAAG